MDFSHVKFEMQLNHATPQQSMSCCTTLSRGEGRTKMKQRRTFKATDRPQQWGEGLVLKEMGPHLCNNLQMFFNRLQINHLPRSIASSGLVHKSSQLQLLHFSESLHLCLKRDQTNAAVA